LALDPSLGESTIVLRDSMVKFKSAYEDLEIMYFNKFRPGYLNRQIILLLVSLGVKEGVF